MSAVLVSPTRTELVTVTVARKSGPSRWIMGPRERRDRLRAAITNSGFALPTGEISVEGPESSSADLAIALATLLVDRSSAHLQRTSWIAWGTVGLDGRVAAVEHSLVNGLPLGPCVGRIWEPCDHVPSPDDDAVISLIDVADLQQAWDVITFFAEAEDVIVGSADVFGRTGVVRNSDLPLQR